MTTDLEPIEGATYLRCDGCDHELLESPLSKGAGIEHNDDGSHTFHPGEPVAARVTVHIAGYTYTATLDDVNMTESTEAVEGEPTAAGWVTRTFPNPYTLNLSGTIATGSWTGTSSGDAS